MNEQPFKDGAGPTVVRETTCATSAGCDQAAVADVVRRLESRGLVDAVESLVVSYVVSETGRLNKAAKVLGIGVRTLQDKLRRMGFKPRQRPKVEGGSEKLRGELVAAIVQLTTGRVSAS